MIEAIFGVAGTIVGTILGFVLSERAARQREERTEKKQAGAVHTMLSLEIDQNLALLRDFWRQLNQIGSGQNDLESWKLKDIAPSDIIGYHQPDYI